MWGDTELRNDQKSKGHEMFIKPQDFLNGIYIGPDDRRNELRNNPYPDSCHTTAYQTVSLP